MATSSERKALWFFALVALSGGGMRLWHGDEPVPAGPSEALDRQIRRVDSARVLRVKRGRQAKPAPNGARKPMAGTPPTPVDLDRASAVEIEELPGIGPALAARIVGHRDSAGFFGSIEALCDVRGIGPALAEKLRPLVTFSGPRRPLSVACTAGSKSPRKGRVARHQEQR